jgi:hydroxymethylbilane synthase
LIVLGTRGSQLALVQANLVVAALRRLPSAPEATVRVVHSDGDLNPEASLTDPQVDGWFTSRLQQELAAGAIDAAVHSAKDLPTATPAGLTIPAYLERADSRDVVITRAGVPWLELAPGSRLGTSSPRRTAQLREVRPDLTFNRVRGNVPTRLLLVDQGEVDGVVVAAAGLLRLGLLGRAQPLDPHRECTPAAGQGAIAVEARADSAWLGVLAALDHPPTRLAVEAERRLLGRMGGGCQLALGALAEPVPAGGWQVSAAYSADGFGLRRTAVVLPDLASENALDDLARRLGASG